MLHKWNQMTFEWNASEVGGWEVLFQPHWEKDCSEPLSAFPRMDSNYFINLHRNYTNAIPWNIVRDMFNIMEFRALGSLQTLQAATALGCGGSDRVTFTFLTFFLVSFFISFQFFAFGYSSRKRVIHETFVQNALQVRTNVMKQSKNAHYGWVNFLFFLLVKHFYSFQFSFEYFWYIRLLGIRLSHILFRLFNPNLIWARCTMVQRPAKTLDLSEGLCCKDAQWCSYCFWEKQISRWY